MDSITISKLKYEELLRKAERLKVLENFKKTEVEEDEFDDLEVKPEYLEKLKNIEKEEGISFKNVEELRKIIECENV